MVDDRVILSLAKGKIAIDGVLKKSVARRLKVDRPKVSRILQGEVPLTPEWREGLIRILGLQRTIERLVTSTEMSLMQRKEVQPDE
jgi:hypothetical protein